MHFAGNDVARILQLHWVSVFCMHLALLGRDLMYAKIEPIMFCGKQIFWLVIQSLMITLHQFH